VRTTFVATSCGLVLALAVPGAASAQARPTAVAVGRADAEFRAVDAQIDQMLRSRYLRVRETMRDAFLDDRRHERFDQYYRGVRIVGGDVTRQSAADGTMSLFGMLHTGLDLGVDGAKFGVRAADGDGGRPRLRRRGSGNSQREHKATRRCHECRSHRASWTSGVERV